jgi:hypothetical protein
MKNANARAIERSTRTPVDSRKLQPRRRARQGERAKEHLKTFRWRVEDASSFDPPQRKNLAAMYSLFLGVKSTRFCEWRRFVATSPSPFRASRDALGHF